MSYDIAVFDPRVELRDRAKFMAWYEARTEFEDDLDYEDSNNATSALQSWYRDMIRTFPPMNGPDKPLDDSSDVENWVADYSIANDIIYVAFSWSKAKEAYETMYRLAAKHGVGFFDASGDTCPAWFPNGSGSLEVAHEEDDDN